MTLPFFLRDVWLAPFFPLATAMLMLVAGRRIANRAIGYLCCGSVLAAFLFSCGTLFELIARPVGDREAVRTLLNWLPAIPFHGAGGLLGGFTANWEFQVDPLSALMLLIVTGVGLLIQVYSIGYMERDGGLPLLRVDEFVRVLDAHAGACRESRDAVRRMGRRGRLQLSADRIPFPQARRRGTPERKLSW